jgi:broad specificity phosphatase PhoE
MSDTPRLPYTERTEPPLYLARYLQRKAGGQERSSAEPADDQPLYLRRFRARRTEPSPTWSGGAWTEAWADNTKSKEIVAPPDLSTGAEAAEFVEIHVVRHGETQGYSVDGGLTPLGSWQAHRRGQELSKGVAGESRVHIVCAPTARAVGTGEHLRRGLEDGLELWGRQAMVDGPETNDDFRNFQVWTPSGIKDPTQAFREYHAISERYERVALGDRPLWLVELDRFWRLQLGGGDPIAFWMSVPLLHFEPPSNVVLRFWRGFVRLAEQTPPGTRIVCATHSGPMRALAAWAFGHDPGEPYNAEEVRVKLRRSLKEALVTFRNRTQEVHVPLGAEWPDWRDERRYSVTCSAPNVTSY